MNRGERRAANFRNVDETVLFFDWRNGPMRYPVLVLAFLCALGDGFVVADDAQSPIRVASRDIESAMRRGLALLEKAGPNWRKHKSCFSCHHQTLPMLAMVEAARAGVAADSAWLKAQADFTHKYFEDHIDVMNSGDHVPGGSVTASYGLWALSLAHQPADETTTAMVSYLLKIQGVVRLKDPDTGEARLPKDGRWMTSCNRPPLQSSQIGMTVLALIGMQRYATDEQRPQLSAARERAEQWLSQAPLQSQEDRIWRLWGIQQLDEDAGTKRLAATREAIFTAQHDDGGWSQIDNLPSDAYSTGQTLFVLCQTGTSPRDPVIQRAAKFLLSTQHADGSWLVETRVKPVQTYFENGDPHGKHQFLSTAATAWATAGLAQLLIEPRDPKVSSRDEFRIFDGQPTRLYFTGNPHHPTFGREKLTKLLDRYFDGKSPIVVDGLADARKDPVTQKPIRPAKIPELIRFLEPVFEAREKQPEPRERLVVLNYVIVESPRPATSNDWVKSGADELEQYAQAALQRGTRRMFFAEMVQPNHIQAGQAGNKFRRAGLQVFDELTSRKIAGIERGPLLQIQMEQHRHFFRDDRHFSDAGRDFIGCLWFATLLKHDGRPVPDWCRDELNALLNSTASK